MSDEFQGGRVFFSSLRRSLEEEDEIRLVSVGVDIGSSTSHLVFSRLLLERHDSRYIVTEREILHQSDVLLTPYADDLTIDAGRLGAFIRSQYDKAGVTPTTIDTGALILTGVAVRRANARAIADLFAAEAGKFVSVSAGDGLEATLAAHGSGAVERSRREVARVMNVDIGGGTAKIAVCDAGAIAETTALDIGARIVVVQDGRAVRIEEAGFRFADELGLDLAVDVPIAGGDLARLAARMADRLFEAMSQPTLDPSTAALLRLDPLANAAAPDIVTFSGGVAEYVYGREVGAFGDLGPLLAREIRQRVESWGPRIERSREGIRATVVGASQYTIQVSGSTIFVSPLDAVPLRNIPVVSPAFALDADDIAAEGIAEAVDAALRRLDLQGGEQAVALCYRWAGSATFGRLDAFCRGIAAGAADHLDRGHPLILVGEGDIGGLVGIHAREELDLVNAIVSIDGIHLQEFDFIDIGSLLETSGAVPVVIKSLVFPTSAQVGRPNAVRVA